MGCMLKEEAAFILKETNHHPSQQNAKGEGGFWCWPWTSVFSPDVNLKGVRSFQELRRLSLNHILKLEISKLTNGKALGFSFKVEIWYEHNIAAKIN